MLATTLNMTAGKTLTVGQSITNNDTIAMSGGMISGSTGVINNGLPQRLRHDHGP
jgi:hypothetical protein